MSNTSGDNISDGIKVSDKVLNLQKDARSLFTVANPDAVNLGQGFPDDPPSDQIKEIVARAIAVPECNQYAPPKGRLHTRQALANAFSPLFNRTLDPETEIIVTAGANEGLTDLFAAFIDHGDQAILIEPFYDQYVNMSSREWKIDINELRSKITPKTKLIVFNNPHNPTGKVFSREEMMEIGAVAQEFNLLIISDEVYERYYYAPDVFERIATLPGMWERTITVGDCGKTFGTTGWCVGWLIGHKDLIKASLSAHTRIVFCVNSPLQEAIAILFEEINQKEYFDRQISAYTSKRENLMSTLSSIGIPYTIPQGSYFVLANTSKIQIPQDYEFPKDFINAPKDFRVCYWLAKEIGIIATPPSEFYSPEHKHIVEDFIRFAFCKSNETLDLAAEVFNKLKPYVKKC
ncbi:16593_t:CDS:2 [Racocetra persica]|uniref:16593_t:CDS:1 n=1 Tax=Racocetra persica TaxID=160502 RepID=A0ACA9LVS5_9GLOM|nr:16593_t:CDS:2 [Racocetra persica]